MAYAPKALVTHIGKGNFVFERASIDKLFLDVTSHCNDTSVPGWQPKGSSTIRDDTVNEKYNTSANNYVLEKGVEPDIPDTVICAISIIEFEQDDEFHAL